MREDKEYMKYLKDWLQEAKSLANNIRAQAKKDGGLSIFTISSTVKKTEESLPYLTPMRKIVHGFIGGSVVFSQTQAVLLSKYVDGLVDQILVDAEKKIGITLGINFKVLDSFGLKLLGDKDNARVHVEMGNLSAACALYIKKSNFHEYKPNDLTVEAVWQLLTRKYGVLSGKKIAIIGSGNIGFKLALKLVESGCHVEMVRRDLWRGILMADTINIVKPKSTIAIAHYNPDPLQAALFCDALIGCTGGIPAITWEMIQSMKPNGIVIDVGKGSIFRDAIQRASEQKVIISRCDISSAVDGLIAAIQRNDMIMKEKMGRREIKKSIFVVSGGYMGLNNDIVVDNYLKPAQVIGVADGGGDIKKKLSDKDRSNIKYLQTHMIKLSTS